MLGLARSLSEPPAPGQLSEPPMDVPVAEQPHLDHVATERDLGAPGDGADGLTVDEQLAALRGIDVVALDIERRQRPLGSLVLVRCGG